MNKNFNFNKIKILNEKLKITKNEILNQIKNLQKYKLFGDLSENPEYQYSKKKLSDLEHEFKTLEKIISDCSISDDSHNKIKKITLKNLKTNKLITCNNSNNYLFEKIKNKKLNDLVKIKIYNKELILKIISIEHN